MEHARALLVSAGEAVNQLATEEPKQRVRELIEAYMVDDPDLRSDAVVN
jgi:hypothetical protein